MNVFVCDVRLTRIKKKCDVSEILALLKKQDASIRYFANGSTVKIESSTNKDRIHSFEYTLLHSMNPLCNVTIVLSEAEAIEQLWKERKYYNMRGSE
ncbi:hypothetical protein [Enterococcus sp. 5H]|uniref:hypothetical protein n=1 Tax=Enterococcus sp. 5H TaxID=1229490 RepID=UPI0023020966|nr:hypothetical protein [Enterococcus sp. 5H]